MTLYVIIDRRNEKAVAFGTDIQRMSDKLISLCLTVNKDFQLRELRDVETISIYPEYWHIITKKALFETRLPGDILK